MPLGDRFPHRPLIVALLALTGLGLLAASAAPGLPPLVGASVLVGVTTGVAPVVAPMAAGLVAEDRRGAVTGTLLSGSIGGMLLSRAFGGSVGTWLVVGGDGHGAGRRSQGATATAASASAHWPSSMARSWHSSSSPPSPRFPPMPLHRSAACSGRSGCGPR